jgi:trehalose synthase-fused probable maltokinase
MSFENRVTATFQESTAWLTDQRWFGDKARTVASTEPEIIDVISLDGRKAALVVVRFSFDWGADSRYFVPVIEPGPGTRTTFGDLGEAFSDPAFLQWFVEGFADRRVMQEDGEWTWRTLGEGLPGAAEVDYASAKPISSEQSNTSIVFDRRFIGKMFRRVQAGLNPDLEIGEFLSTDDRFAHSPKLYGLVEVVHGGSTTAIAAMQQYVPNEGDGWTWLLDELRALTPESLAGTVKAIRLLARRTGELHVALASDHENGAFAPELFTSVDAQSLIQRVINEIDESVEGLVRHLPPAEVERIHKGMGQLMGDAHHLVGTYKIRVHGDYHLGQTLRTTDGDFVLIDFEGEPSRTMEQRRMKLPALKDVAGMVRSLDYAAATILQDEQDTAKRDLVHQWRREATAAYIDAFREAVASASVPLVPAEDRVFTDALNLMIAEKALYEVRYELNNRPTWLSIPLNALRALVGMDAPANAD